MVRFFTLHIIFLIVALLIAFALVPLEQLYLKDLPVEEVKKYYSDALSFESAKAWKLVFTWFLGLSCGRIMLRALAKN
ncbi:MAG: hypothetical protein AB8B92_05685 [Gammaproteobacteria bacterium]